MLRENIMVYQTNRGKICKNDRCNNVARVKGLCVRCYQYKRSKLKKE